MGQRESGRVQCLENTGICALYEKVCIVSIPIFQNTQLLLQRYRFNSTPLSHYHGESLEELFQLTLPRLKNPGSKW